jgi:TfoX/Sxy family transcriptional regulator of competence genes
VAYDERLADDVRALIGSRTDVREQEMFGGIAFMINGNMAVGVSGNDLMVRVGKEAHDEAVSHPGVSTFGMGERPMRGWLRVSEEGTATDAGLKGWVDRGVAYAESLPPK